MFAPIIKMLKKINMQQHDFEETRALAKKCDETGRVLIKACIAILDGLKQQGCNGNVSDMHERLIAYAVDK